MNNDLINDLNVMMRVSLCCPQDVPERAFRILRRVEERSMSDWMCGVKVRCVSRVIPKIRGVRLRGSVVFWRVMLGLRFDW